MIIINRLEFTTETEWAQITLQVKYYKTIKPNTTAFNKMHGTKVRTRSNATFFEKVETRNTRMH